MTTIAKNALVMLGTIGGGIALTALTVAYHTYFWPSMPGDGQYGMVLFPTATGGGLCYGAALTLALVNRPGKPAPECVSLTLIGLGFSAFWILLWPSSGALFCLPSLLVGFCLLASFGVARRS